MDFFAKLKVPLEEGESSLEAPSSPFQTLNLTLRGLVAVAVESNPDMLLYLYKERIEAACGQMRTQLEAMPPNLSSNVRQIRQTTFLGSFGFSSRSEFLFYLYFKTLTDLSKPFMFS